MLAGAHAVQGLERVDDASVKSDPPRRGHAFVERVAEEDVGEAEPAGCVVNVRDHCRVHCLVQEVKRLGFGQPHRPGDRRRREFTAEHRREQEHVSAGVGKVRQPPRDDRSNALRKRST